MKIINFYPKTFAEIPAQDNPAFNTDQCLMLVKEVLPSHESARVVVLLIDPKDDPYSEETVTNLAVFWKEEIALAFCQSFTPENL